MSRVVSIVLLAACMSLIPELAPAEAPKTETPPAGTQAEPAPSMAPPAGCLRPRDLVTVQEMAAHRQKMRSLPTQEEQVALHNEWRAELEARAQKKGGHLCPMPQGRGPGPRGPGGGMGGGMGPGMGPGGPPPAGGPTPPMNPSPPTPETPAPPPTTGGGATPQK